MLFDAPGTPVWTTPGATVALLAGKPLDLNVSIFIAVTARTASALSGLNLTASPQLIADVAAAAKAQAQADVDWANLIFEVNRVGFRIVAKYTELSPSTSLPAEVGADPFSCAKPRTLPPPKYDQNTISAYYVDWIDIPSDPLHPGARGWHCRYWFTTGTPGPVLFISYTRHSSVTLAHELGHALNLGEAEGTLGAVNVMNNLAPDSPLGASARSRLTLGQVFRMNVSGDAWVNTAAGPRVGALTRSCVLVGQCPPLDLDVR
jgi:hypothetical protein